jgi:hypothetical protein
MPMIDIGAHGGIFGGKKLPNKPLPYHKFYKDKPVLFNFFGTGKLKDYNTNLWLYINKRFSDRLAVGNEGNGTVIWVYDLLNCYPKQNFSISPYSMGYNNFAYVTDNGDFICVCNNGVKTYLGRLKYNPSTGLYNSFQTVEIYNNTNGNAQIITGFVETDNYYVLTTDSPATQTVFINKENFTLNRIVTHPSGITLKLLAYDEQNDIVYGYQHGSATANLIFVKFNGTIGSQILRLDIPVNNGSSNGYYATSVNGVFLDPSKQYICKVMGKTNDKTSGGLCIVYFDATTGAFVRKVDIQDSIFLDDDYYAIYPYTVYNDGHVLMGVTNSSYTTDINKLMIIDINTGVVKAYTKISSNTLVSWQFGWNFGTSVYSLGGYGSTMLANCIELYKI